MDMTLGMTNITMDMGAMLMYLHTSVGSDTILFKGCKPSTPLELFVACVIAFLVTIGYEGLKHARRMLQLRHTRSVSSDEQNIRWALSNKQLIVQSVLHSLQYFVSYALMLVVMTYQVYLYLAVVLGAGVGFFLFNPLRSKLRSNYNSFDEVCC